MSRTLILDTGLLVLFVVGAAGEHLIASHRRLSAFSVEDYGHVRDMVGSCSKLLLVPHVLAETSNLARQVRRDAQAEVSAILKLLVDRFPEEHVPSADAASHGRYLQLGLTDAVLLRLSSRHDCVLVTTDHDLYGVASSEGCEVYNYQHFQAAAYARYAGPQL